jgi:hypothetical protein
VVDIGKVSVWKREISEKCWKRREMNQKKKKGRGIRGNERREMNQKKLIDGMHQEIKHQ